MTLDEHSMWCHVILSIEGTTKKDVNLLYKQQIKNKNLDYKNNMFVFYFKKDDNLNKQPEWGFLGFVFKNLHYALDFENLEILRKNVHKSSFIGQPSGGFKNN